MSKLFFYDLETTGVKFWRNGIHQIAGIVVIDDIEVDSIKMDVKPFERAEIEPEALAVSGKTISDIATHIEMKTAYNRLTEMLGKYVDRYNKKDKFHLIGFNNRQFDDQFLRAFFTQCGDNYFGSFFWSDSLDVMVLASWILNAHRATMADFKLRTVAKHLGVEFNDEEAHDALYDIRKTRECFTALEVMKMYNVSSISDIPKEAV